MNTRICCISLSAVAAAGLGAGLLNPQVAEQQVIFDQRLWGMFAGGPNRVSRAHASAIGPASIANPRWVKQGDDLETFEFYGQAGVVTTDSLIIAVGFQTEFGTQSQPTPNDGLPGVPGGTAIPGTPGGTTHGAEPTDPGSIPNAPRGVDSVVAFSRIDGSVVWATNIPIALLDSWSTPCVDQVNGTLIVAAGGQMIALSLEDGSEVWSTSLGRIVVNASPVATHDLGDSNRAFITDHSFATGSSGRLYCINTSPFLPGINPYQPGAIVWSVSLEGQTSGNTPAYRDGVVYVSTATGGSEWDQGTIRAYPAAANTAPQPLWRYEHTDPTGFFAGMAVTGDAIFASTYSFHGGQYSASTVRLDRSNGRQIWVVPTNRTDMVPVPLDGGLVLVSGGLPFISTFPAFGSLPSLQLIQEHPRGLGATLLWDSAMDTLVDLNDNGAWDPGEPFLNIGGWTNQPIVFRDKADRLLACVGSAPDPGVSGFFGPSTALTIVDLSKNPWEHGFVAQSATDCGGSPALADREIYAVGASGLYAFGAPSWSRGVVLARWANQTLPDFNGDGVLNGTDLMLALQHARD